MRISIFVLKYCDLIWLFLIDFALMEESHLGFDLEGVHVVVGLCSAILRRLFWICVFLHRLRYVVNCCVVLKIADHV